MELEPENPATWKFKWYEALTVGVKPKNLPVAQILLQHCSGKGGLINPSQARIAYLLGCDTSTVERAIKELAAMGVIQKVRWSRTASNRYCFVEAWKETQILERIRLSMEWQEQRQKDPAELQGRVHEKDTRSRAPTPQD